RYRFNENSRQLLGGTSGHRISVGDAVRVILDRIDAVENKLQFALVEQVTIQKKNLSGKKTTSHPGAHPSKKRQKKSKKRDTKRR
ncbi:MAG: hypothetical protein ABI076_04865, partial [Acidobacteriaceae bacterium]